MEPQPQLFRIRYESEFSEESYSDPMTQEDADREIRTIKDLNLRGLAAITYGVIPYDPSVLTDANILANIKCRDLLPRRVVDQAFQSRKAFKYACAILERDDAALWYFDILERFYSQNDVMMNLAKRGNLPDFILWKLALHPYNMVRLKVAGYPGIPSGLIKLLAKDSDERIRRAIAGRKATPNDILEVLYNDPSVEVQRIVERRVGFETAHLRVRKSVGLTSSHFANLGIYPHTLAHTPSS